MINTHLKVFDTEANYEAGKLNLDMPNVSYCEDTEKLKYLNSKMDLYDIYGVTTGAGNTVTLTINGNNTTATSDDNKEFGVVVTGTTTGISFRNCANITTLDLSKLDTSNVTSMYKMFDNCNQMTSVVLSGLDTSRVTNMSDMFYNCTNLSNLDLSGFDTSSLTNTNAMFAFNYKIGNLNLSNWDMTNVTNTDNMFMACNRGSNTITMNNTNTTTFDKIKAQLVTNNVASYFSIIRDGLTWTYNGSSWVSQ